MLARAKEELLSHLIDYAGLFPPASLSMEEAVANYERYMRGEYAWMLGRFVVPAARADEVPGVRHGAAVPYGTTASCRIPLSVIGDAPYEMIETNEIVEPNGRIVYVEGVPIPELAKRGLRAKIRTGGVTQDAFPSVEVIAQFIRECRDHRVPFKATAGLHHPLRCVKPLTYEPDAPTGPMHGFLNVFMAAATPDRAEEILMSNEISFDDVSPDEIAEMRRTFAISFGSCSFEEPIADLKELGWF